jgi:hypothetical protein
LQRIPSGIATVIENIGFKGTVGETGRLRNGNRNKGRKDSRGLVKKIHDIHRKT